MNELLILFAALIVLVALAFYFYSLSRFRHLESAVNRMADALGQPAPEVERQPRHGWQRWLSFRMSTMLIGTTIVGVSCAMIARELDKTARLGDAIENLRHVGADVSIQNRVPRDPSYYVCGFTDPDDVPPPEWVTYVMGDFYGCRVFAIEFRRREDFTTATPSLDVASLHCQDDDLQCLSDCVGLQKLSLRHTDITDEALQHIGSCTSLRDLTLADTAINGSGFHYLARLHNLTYLDLRGTAVKDEYLQQLARLTSLKGIYLPTHTTDSSLEVLAKQSNIDSLDLEETLVTPEGIGKLKSLPNLRCLFLNQECSTKEGLAQLEGIKTLRVLRLVANGLTVDELKTLSKFEHLKELDLYTCYLGEDEAIEVVSTMKHLKFLRYGRGHTPSFGASLAPTNAAPTDFDLPDTEVTLSQSREEAAATMGGGGLF